MPGLIDLYPQYEDLLAKVQLVLFMVGMGATLAPSAFTPVFKQPRALLYGLTFQLIATPFLAVLVSRVAGLEAGLAIGLLLVASLPGGTLSNAFTHLSLSNVPLSIALSAVATVLAILTIPFVIELLTAVSIGGQNRAVASQLEMPAGVIVRDIFLYMLIPLGIGMLVEHYLPGQRRLVSRACIVLGFALVVVMVVGAIGADRIDLGEHGWKGPLAIIGFCVLTQQCAMILIRFSRWPTGDWVAIGIEATIRNVYLGILLATLVCPPGETGAIGKQVFFVVLFYGPASLGAALPLALRIRRLHRKQATQDVPPEVQLATSTSEM